MKQQHEALVQEMNAMRSANKRQQAECRPRAAHWGGLAIFMCTSGFLLPKVSELQNPHLTLQALDVMIQSFIRWAIFQGSEDELRRQKKTRCCKAHLCRHVSFVL